MKKILLIILIICIAALAGCQLDSSTSENSTGDLLLKMAENGNGEQADDIPISNPLGFTNEFVDGLHVTGSPVEVNIAEYRLEVTGEVNNPLSLTFDEVKGMENKRIFAELDCPGFFTDEGYWTGVDLRMLLDLAEIADNASEVSFSSIDGYQRSLTIDEVMENDGLLVAYNFQDKEFPEVHGYPLRIVARGETGSVWVKWLAKIEVIASTEVIDDPAEVKN